MANLVIVAIPNEDDYVWKLSSEKVPHCTLLFLGDAVSNPNVFKIQQFLEHAVNILEFGPFGLSVDHRGELGADKADVLFFRDDWSLKRVKQFRGQLLKNDAIRRAYENAPQHDLYPDGWTPHLTMGYPATPARADKRDYPGTRWVEFDKIALWYGNYEGPEYRLEYNWDDFAEVGMSVEAGKEFVSHFGVKGMKWGQRKQRIASGAKRIGRGVANVAFELSTGSDSTRGEIHDRANTAFKKHDLPALKTKHQTGGKLKTRVLKPASKEAKAYRKDARDAYVKRLEEAANSMTNLSGTRRFTLSENGKPNTSQYYWNVHTEKVVHADVGDFRVQPVFDSDGFITDLVLATNSVAQTIDLGAEFISHYGVKGMKWGVRRGHAPAAREVQARGVVRQVGKTKVKSTGGQHHPATKDAIDAALAKQKLKRSGHHALSNQELADLANRMNLEQQVTRLVRSQPASPAKQLVKSTLADVGKQQVKRIASEAATQGTNELIKRAKAKR